MITMECSSKYIKNKFIKRFTIRALQIDASCWLVLYDKGAKRELLFASLNRRNSAKSASDTLRFLTPDKENFYSFLS